MKHKIITILPFYAEEMASDELPSPLTEMMQDSPEVVHVKEDPDPSIKHVVEESQKAAYTGRRMMGITLSPTHRPTVIPYSWR